MLKELREKKGIRQQDLANETGVSIKTISRIENGDENIQYRNLKVIAKYFNVKIENLYEK
jgi:transcriptional regulator with XRE-family HTH domain